MKKSIGLILAGVMAAITLLACSAATASGFDGLNGVISQQRLNVFENATQSRHGVVLQLEPIALANDRLYKSEPIDGLGFSISRHNLFHVPIKVIDVGKGHAFAGIVLQKNPITIGEVHDLFIGELDDVVHAEGWLFGTGVTAGSFSLLSHNESSYVVENSATHQFEIMGGRLNGFELPLETNGEPKGSPNSPPLTGDLQAQKKTMFNSALIAASNMRGSNPGAGFCQQQLQASAFSAMSQTLRA